MILRTGNGATIDTDLIAHVHKPLENFGSYWGEHPDHCLSDWRYEVANNDTRLGYWEWVAMRLYDGTQFNLREEQDNEEGI